MKTLAPLVALFMLSAFSRGIGAQDLTGYEKLPPIQDRTIVGQWDVGNSCTGAIISGDGKAYWAWVCIVNTGCCNGLYGYVLQGNGRGVYVDAHRNVIYTLQTGGSLRITTNGRTNHVYSSKLGKLNPSWTDLAPWQEQ